MRVVCITADQVGLAAPLFAGYREFYGEPYDLDSAATFLTERLERAESIVFLALEGDEAVGFTQIYPSFSSTRLAPIWILNDLFVTEAARGTGPVDAILGEVETAAIAAGAIEVELATAHTNHRAQSVYDRHGYRPDEHYRHYAKQVAPNVVKGPK